MFLLTADKQIHVFPLWDMIEYFKTYKSIWLWNKEKTNEKKGELMEDQDNQGDQRFNDIYKYKPSSKFESPCVAQKLTS